MSDGNFLSYQVYLSFFHYGTIFCYLAYSFLNFIDWKYPYQLHIRSLSLEYAQLRVRLLFRCQFCWQYITALADSKFHLYRSFWFYWIHSCHGHHSIFHSQTSINQWKNENSKSLRTLKKYTHDFPWKLGYSQFLMIFYSTSNTRILKITTFTS